MIIKKIGKCTLICGDTLAVLPELTPDFTGVLTDPPYSSGGLYKSARAATTAAKYTGNKTGGPAVYNPALIDFSGDNKDQRSFVTWSMIWLGQALALCREGSIAAVFTDWRQLPCLVDSFQGGGWIWRGIGVWDKTEGARPNLGLFRHQCEYFIWGTNGKNDPSRRICAPGYFRISANAEPRLHQTGKPIGMLGQILPMLGENILDPFMGSGSAGIACVRAGISYTGIEISRHYFDIACARIEEACQREEGRGKRGELIISNEGVKKSCRQL